MKPFLSKIILFFTLTLVLSCKQENSSNTTLEQKVKNTIEFAKDLEIYKYKGFSILKVKNPWPNANKDFTYILQEKNGIIPDSLKQHTAIQVPIKTVVATSTTHIASLVMLGVENTLVGFPHLDYISSEKVRKNIDSGKVKELGNNQTLNVEIAIDLAPSVIVGYGLDNHNPSLDNLEKSGLKVILNGDWNEQSPLGKAEWIKFFGALYGKEELANTLFNNIKEEYHSALAIAKSAQFHPTVFAGSMYEEIWYVPQGQSWGSLFLKDAGAHYIWTNEKGTGGLSLSFEKVFEKAQNADFWIGPGQFNSLEEMAKTNPHYTQFKAFKTKQVYSYSIKKGKTGGLIYFEEAPNRPDLVLKDLVKIFHPELLTDYKLHFFQKLK